LRENAGHSLADLGVVAIPYLQVAPVLLLPVSAEVNAQGDVVFLLGDGVYAGVSVDVEVVVVAEFVNAPPEPGFVYLEPRFADGLGDGSEDGIRGECVKELAADWGQVAFVVKGAHVLKHVVMSVPTGGGKGEDFGDACVGKIGWHYAVDHTMRKGRGLGVVGSVGAGKKLGSDVSIHCSMTSV
jgi:hypothetical protein